MDSTPSKPALPPGSTGLPLVGETLPFLRDMFGFIGKRMEATGEVFRTNILGKDTVFLAGPEACELWLDQSLIQREGSFPGHIQELFGGRSLPLLDGAEHLTRKRLVMTAFTREALASYLPVLERTTAAYLAAWSGKGEVGLLDELKRLSVEGICASLFGMKPGAEMDALLADYRTLMLAFSGLPLNVPGTAYAGGLKARDRILARIEKLVVDHQNAPSQHADDGLSRLLAARSPEGVKLTVDQVKLELHHMIIAGLIIFAELAAMVMAFAAHPQVRDRLEAEVKAAAPADGGPLTPEKLRAMPFLMQVVMEVKRSCLNVPVSFGKARKSFEFKGYTVPEGWLVFMAVGQCNHFEKSFADPARFDPDRFGPERAEHEKHPQAFVPQGAGTFDGHRCAGLDFSTVFMQVFAALLVRDHAVTLPAQDLSLRPDLVPPEPRGGLRAVVTKR